jgi:hypothetical protein
MVLGNDKLFAIFIFLIVISTASTFFYSAFGSHNGYSRECQEPNSSNQPPYSEQLPSNGVLTSVTYSNGNSNLPNDTFNRTYSLYVSTDKVKYVPGDFINIYGEVLDEKGCHVDTTVRIMVKHESHSTPIYEGMAFSTSGIYASDALNAYDTGKYQIFAWVDGSNDPSKTLIEITNFFMTIPAYIMYIGLAFFGGLMIVIAKGIIISSDVSEILRFICITGIVFSPVAALALSDVEIGTKSPLGLVRRHALDENGVPQCPTTNSQQQSSLEQGSFAATSEPPQEGGEWVINVGGRPEDCFAEGIQIPVNVFIFGIFGGYLRYLWKTAKLRVKKQEELPSDASDKANTRTWLFYQSLEDLALLFLSPLLAIAVWFVLWQGGTTGNYAVAVISFTVGLVTEEVIQTLIRFTGSMLKLPESTQKEREQTQNTRRNENQQASRD